MKTQNVGGEHGHEQTKRQGRIPHIWRYHELKIHKQGMSFMNFIKFSTPFYELIHPQYNQSLVFYALIGCARNH